jgi:hypothetical protein
MWSIMSGDCMGKKRLAARSLSELISGQLSRSEIS